ncbi:MAG TPA: hypothetical protein VGA52_00380 [Anaerolineales bacterium]|jgi:hypothetical protein
MMLSAPVEALAVTVSAGANLAHFFAYLDPGSGSYLLQLLIAGAMGGLLMLRIYWSKVKAFFLRLFGRSVEEESE